MHFSHLLNQKQTKWRRAFIVSSIFLFLMALLALSVGELFIFPLSPQGELESQLLYQLRMPRLIAAIVIGAALAVSGASLQVLLGNPLAEPGVLGISGGASLALVVLLFVLPVIPSPALSMIAAMLGALFFTIILVGLATKLRLSTSRTLLVGVALGILSGAVVTWAFYFSSDLNLRLLMYWLMGSIGGVSWQQLSVVVIMIPVIFWLCRKGKSLDQLMMGETYAKQLGLDTDKLRWRLIIAVSLLVGASVALAGVIGFIGLVVPHLLRLAFGTENRFLLPLSAIVGAALLVFADTLARVLLPSAELPVGVMTTSIGAPIFIWMLLKNHA
ncbi:vitamin B12 ABC transporter permease BtuC [Vibrio sp. Of7-15]|uniref:vitamin B12 ABC transporter permease BtuC n=1 Tax=Vibrio sp. Of7-15 TaxID=2724879 RepID=UPI001EF2AC68|nr:vitamin B12 ABC transporter permease BtuC [Vibrio sp. Of7-15]MCG7496296.1 vitamin B12 ABC transporter permease BtuC [Vibrio sp. Of7-15]